MYHLSLLSDEAADDDDDDDDDGEDANSATVAAVTSPSPFVRSRQVRFSELAFSTCSELSPRICVSGTAVGKRREGEREEDDESTNWATTSGNGIQYRTNAAHSFLLAVLYLYLYFLSKKGQEARGTREASKWVACNRWGRWSSVRDSVFAIEERERGGWAGECL